MYKSQNDERGPYFDLYNEIASYVDEYRDPAFSGPAPATPHPPDRASQNIF
jgi:hypothetical protein